MSNNFRVGQKVVCIKCGTWIHAGTGQSAHHPNDPRYGQVHTIRTLFIGPKGQLYLDLIGNDLGGYNAKQFRPAVERKADISVFTRMLTDRRVDA